MRKDCFVINGGEPSNIYVATLAQRLTSQWNSSFHALFVFQNFIQISPECIFSAYSEIPKWEASSFIELIGDVISPTAVLNAVTALRDASTLTQVVNEEGIQA